MIRHRFNPLGIDTVKESEDSSDEPDVMDVTFRVQDSTQTSTYLLIDEIIVNGNPIEYTLNDYWYTFQFEVGSTIRLTVKKSGYIDYDQAISLDTLNNNTLQLTEEMAIGSRREVSTWSTGSRDLDSHFVVLNKNGSKVYEKFYQNKNSDYVEGEMRIHLDKDETNYGTETITCVNLNYEKYDYAFIILDYINRNSTTSKVLSNSNVTVVINGHDGSSTIQPPKNVVGVIWEIYRIIDGNLEILNNVTNTNNYHITK